MSSLTNFQILAMPACRVIGKSLVQKFGSPVNPIPALWQQCFGDGTFETLGLLPAQRVAADYVGFMCGWNNESGTFTYICGMLFAADTPVPATFTSWDCPASTAAVAWIQGPEKENYPVAHQLTQAELEKQGYQVDDQAGWCMEYYNCPRFTQPQPDGEVILDYYIPCKPAAPASPAI